MDTAELSERLIAQRHDVVLVGDVTVHAHHLGALLRQSLKRSIERGVLDVTEHQVHARARETPRRREANATRPARDDRRLSL